VQTVLVTCEHDRRIWLSVGLGAFAVRMAAAVATGGVWRPELNEYSSIARNMLRGDGFTYSHLGVVYHSFAPPLHAWITAAGYALTDSIVPLMVLQAAAGAALAVTTALIAARVFASPAAGVAAAVLVVIHPGLVVYGAMKAHPLTFDALFFSLALLQGLRLVERPTTRGAVVLGLIVGVGALSRATILVFLPMFALFLLATVPRTAWLRAAGRMVIAGGCAAAVLAPWTLRNSLLHDRFVLMVTTDQESFWRGNNPYATGHSYVDAGRIVLELLPTSELDALRKQPDELAQADWFRARARDFIRDDPRAFVHLTAAKFFHFWWFAPQSGILYPRLWLNAYKAFYVVTLTLAAAGVACLVRTRRELWRSALFIVAFVLALSVLQSLYYVEGRHRWAVEPLVLVLSGGGLAALASRLHATSPRVRALTGAP
jgi:4-amino-4-deoxy-L-arabinose transferase-like glycosyltransferase